MSKKTRDIVIIDEELCDGCGDCIISCAEGAIQIIDGKAKLVSENLCDGFGNCLGVCPLGAITVEKREVDDFDEVAVNEHLKNLEVKTPATPTPAGLSLGNPQMPHHHSGGCPGSAMKSFATPSAGSEGDTAGEIRSTLTQWPVQLMLVPPTAPFFKGREILLAADCCPFAFADFHRKFLKDKALLIGCPKLDNLPHYKDKLTEVFRDSGCTGVTVMVMEVPCCTGLKIATIEAMQAAGVNLPIKEVVIGVQGTILNEAAVA